MSNALDNFNPQIRSWFEGRFKHPTAVQNAAWPVIASGAHSLITAPTGSGKTLTAFLWSLNRFANNDWQPGVTRLLYVSPLKALNNDIQRNLLDPMQALADAGALPRLKVQTRSGDTSQTDRQRMLRKPPDILITTPESLTLLLTTTRGRLALSTVETLIIDEVHSLVDNRRGVALMAAAERLLHITGSLQRIALSATVSPLEEVATYIGGYDDKGTARSVSIVNPPSEKAISLKVHYPDEIKEAAHNGESVWDPLAEKFRDVALNNRSTLFFTNSRAMAEKITLKINEQSPSLLAYAHHGSLAREIRAEVERRLKQGELKAIVATSSLEMGIDIGSLDQVVLLQSPPGIAATLQRIGRAGHSVGEESRGALYPVHAADFVEAAALSTATIARDLEPLVPLKGALDTLSQIIISMCANEKWNADDIYQLVKRSAAYQKTSREQFELVLELLSGRYAGSRIRELQSRIVYNRIDGTITAKKNAVFALYNSGGSIPDRGYYQIRHADTGAKIGELDEEFVWEARVGDTFALGTQHWQIKQINHNDVLVKQSGAGNAPPFWRAERNNRSHHYAQRIGAFLLKANNWLASGQQKKLQAHLKDDLCFDEGAAVKLIEYLQRQRDKSATDLPHRHHVLLELVETGPGGYKGPDNQKQLILHTHWGGRLNHPWALALQSAWQEKFSETPKLHADNDAIVIQLHNMPDPAQVISLVTPENLNYHLRRSLESSGFFGTRFRECAGRFLLLPRQRFNQRLPLWMSRLQAKKLMSATITFEDFPVMLEAWRTCLKDEFELPALTSMLNEVADGVCAWSFIHTQTPTPFASNLTFDQINQYMYADDTPDQQQVSALSEDLIKETALNSQLRPSIDPAINQQFIAKRQRTHPDYQPADKQEWIEWVKERVLISHNEWWEEWQDQPSKSDRLLCELSQNDRRWVCHLEDAYQLINSGLAAGASVNRKKLPRLDNDERSAESLATEVLSFYGPLSIEEIKTLLPTVPDALLEDERFIQGTLLEGDTRTTWCSLDNFEILLRWQRSARRPSFEPLGVKHLPGILANWHRFNVASSEQTVIDTVEKLRGYHSRVQPLLNDFFTARLKDFSEHQLDNVFLHQQLSWLGTDKEQCCLCYPEDIELLRNHNSEAFPLAPYFSDAHASYNYLQISTLARDPNNHSQGKPNIDNINETWWQGVWSGKLTADSLAPLKQGARSNFNLSVAASSTGRVAMAKRRARALSNAWPGNWQLIPDSDLDNDPLTELEERRERVHILLDRYGVITSELANREINCLRFGRLFKALRVMELAGEVTQGLFIEGLSGPQFISPRALARLQQKEKPPTHFWCNALDPISPCGLGVDWPELPQRRAQNYLSFYKGELALVIENNGSRLHFYIDPQDNALDRILEPCVHITKFTGKLTVKTINGEPATTSPYLAAISRVLKKRKDHRNVYFEL